MNFLLILSLLFPTNTSIPCAQEIKQTVVDPEKERIRKIDVELRIKKVPVISAVNPEEKDLFSVENSYQPYIGSTLIIKMPNEWTLLGLSNIKIQYQNYLIAQVQRKNDKEVLEIILPRVLTINLNGSNDRIWRNRVSIAKDIEKAIREQEKKEQKREIELADYKKVREAKEAEIKRQQEEKERQNKIISLQKQILTNDDLGKGCFVILSEIKDKEGIVWEIWNCKDVILAKPTFKSKKFIFQNKQSIIKMENDLDKEKALEQIERVKEAAKLKIPR